MPDAFPAPPGGPMPAAAPPMGANPDLVRQLQSQSATLASAAEDIRNASRAFREKNQEQVAEILRRGARKVSQAGTEARGLTQAMGGARLGSPQPPGAAAPGPGTVSAAPPGGAAADPFAPLPVPAVEPTDPAQRQALEAAVRDRLRQLHQPYLRLDKASAEAPQVQAAVRACRDAVNRGSLRQAVINLNTAAQSIGDLVSDLETDPSAVG